MGNAASFCIAFSINYILCLTKTRKRKEIYLRNRTWQRPGLIFASSRWKRGREAGAGAEAPEGRTRSKWRPAGRGGAAPAALSALGTPGPSRAGLCGTEPSHTGPGAPAAPGAPQALPGRSVGWRRRAEGRWGRKMAEPEAQLLLAVGLIGEGRGRGGRGIGGGDLRRKPRNLANMSCVVPSCSPDLRRSGVLLTFTKKKHNCSTSGAMQRLGWSV